MSSTSSESRRAAKPPVHECIRRAGYPRPVTTTTPPTTDLRLVVGYDGSPPGERALNAAVNLLQGRTGRIEVVYVAHMSSMAALSPAAVTELETDFDETE